MLTVGDRFPSFKLKGVVSLDKGKEFADVSSEAQPDKWKVVFFWPKDFTFVCPTEIAEFGAQVQGVHRPGHRGVRGQPRQRIRAPGLAAHATPI